LHRKDLREFWALHSSDRLVTGDFQCADPSQSASFRNRGKSILTGKRIYIQLDAFQLTFTEVRDRPFLYRAIGSNGSGPGVEPHAPNGCCSSLTGHSNVEIGGLESAVGSMGRRNTF
jgi:hypothetical protein